MTKQRTRLMVGEIKKADQDFEWYPTKKDTIDIILTDMKVNGRTRDDDGLPLCSVLDVGAGDGRVLDQLTQGEKFAIEKSKPLLAALPRDVAVVGTEFKEAELFSMKVDVVFSNPPYSDYVEWSTRLIKESLTKYLYLVIPKRWKDNEQIKYAIKRRKAVVEVLQEGDFLDGDRAARAKFNLVRVYFGDGHEYMNRGYVDPFDVMFEETFPETNAPENNVPDYEKGSAQREKLHDTVHQLVDGTNLVETLVNLYNADVDKMIEVYRQLVSLPSDIFIEMDFDIDKVKSALKKKIESLKVTYWKELFENFDDLKSKLTSGSKEKLVSMLGERTGVSFTRDNAYAITLATMRNANALYDQQLVDMFSELLDSSNVVRYKSNKKTFEDDGWRFSYSSNSSDSRLDYYGPVGLLDYRIVVNSHGCIHNESWGGINGISHRASNFINDWLVIAGNLGFNIVSIGADKCDRWHAGELREFFATYNDEIVTLMAVRMYKKGTIHIKFNSRFIMMLNVEVGKLRGWVKSKEDILSEMDFKNRDAKCKSITPNEVNVNELVKDNLFKLNMGSMPLLLESDK